MNTDIFKAYDIRGIYPTEIDEDTIYRIGVATVAELNAKKLAVGRDARQSGPSLHKALIDGITDAGCDVIDLGMVTTPMLYFASHALRVDGGASANNFLMRYQTDISGIRVERPTCVESTALGAASLAGLAAGVWGSRDELIGSGELTVFEPAMSETERASRLKIWKRAVSRAGHWADAD